MAAAFRSMSTLTTCCRRALNSINGVRFSSTAAAASSSSSSFSFNANANTNANAVLMSLNMTPCLDRASPLQQPSFVFGTMTPALNILPQVHSSILEIDCPCEPTANEPLQAVKRTYQPSVLRRKRKHGFRARRVSISGRKVLTRRFLKNRKRMSV